MACLLVRFLVPLGAVLALLACSAPSGATLDARYDARLAAWQDAPRSRLLADWGAPSGQATLPDGGEVLVFVTRHDIAAPRAAPAMTVTGGPGHPAVLTGGALDALPPAPVTCTTRFELHDGRVTAWRFEGLGCGVPG